MNNNIANTKRNYTEYCANGFLLSKETSVIGWENVNFGEYYFYYSPSTYFNYFFEKNTGILVVGNSFDVVNGFKTEKVIDEIKKKLEESIDEAIKYIAYLAGRFLIVLIDGEDTYIIPDSHCTYVCYWSENNVNVYSSHLQVFKDFYNEDKSLLLSRIMGSSDYVSPGGKYFPAKLTPLKHVYPIIANCYLKVNVASGVKHKRFYPFFSLGSKYKGYDKNTIYILFKNYLINILKLSYVDGSSYISLTNGLDSRAVLAAALIGGLKYDTFTYTKFGGDYPHYEKDLVGASKISTHAGYSHFIVTLPPLDYGNSFYRMYAKTFSLHARFPTLTQAYYEQLPLNSNVLISTISETGTVFYTERDEKNITARVLSRKWTNSKINSDVTVLKEFEEYIEYTQFSQDKIFDFDFYDLYYWEHRNSKWANIWYQECDLSHKVVLPFNCRLINELMLAMDFDDRKSRYLLNKLIQESGLSSSGDFYA